MPQLPQIGRVRRDRAPVTWHLRRVHPNYFSFKYDTYVHNLMFYMCTLSPQLPVTWSAISFYSNIMRKTVFSYFLIIIYEMFTNPVLEYPFKQIYACVRKLLNSLAFFYYTYNKTKSCVVYSSLSVRDK